MPNTTTTTTSTPFPNLKPFYKLWDVGDDTASGILSMLYRLADYDVAADLHARSFSQVANLVGSLLPNYDTYNLGRATEAAYKYYLWAHESELGVSAARTTQSSDDTLTRQEHAPCTTAPASTPPPVATDDVIASIRKRIVALVDDAVMQWDNANYAAEAARANYRVSLKTAAHTLAREVVTQEMGSSGTGAAPENTSRVGFEDASW